jgi:hypothetical protein
MLEFYLAFLMRKAGWLLTSPMRQSALRKEKGTRQQSTA